MKPQAPLPEQIIYLVDDDEALRDSLVWLLESQGFKVEAFARQCLLDGFDTLGWLQSKLPYIQTYERFREPETI